MRSRWFHKPHIHVHDHGHEKKVSWLELFYDLIFVAGIIQLGDFLGGDSDVKCPDQACHDLVACAANSEVLCHAAPSVSLASFGLFALHFVPLWIAWTGFTFYANRYDVDDFLHRVLVLTNMFALGTMAIGSHQAMVGHHEVYALATGTALGIVAMLYFRSWRQEPESADYSRFWAIVWTIAASLFFLSALLPVAWAWVTWAIAVASVLFSPVSPSARALAERYPLDMEHLSERYGLLTIIVLGESFVKVLTYLTGKGDISYLPQGFFNLLLTCSLWWMYFDDVAGTELKKTRGSFSIWLYSHLPLTLAITGVGVAVKKAIKFDLHEVAYEPYRWLLAGTLALTFLSVAVIDSVTKRKNNQLSDRNRVVARVGSALIILLLGQIGGAMDASTFLALVAALCAGQVLFDMMMAPFEDAEIEHTPVAHLAQERIDGKAERPKRVDLGQAVRKGMPPELRQDLYFFFMEGSWTRLLASFGFIYLFLNVVFAGLFMLDPGSFSGDGSFRAAFSFSVQTLSTIGYGALTPGNEYGDTLVAIESAVGIFFAAMATGLMFAKASRPQASVLFAEHPIITTRHGARTLMLRVANARGNEVVDAEARVSIVVEEISAEGHHMRRLHDLELERDKMPLFMLSWTMLHVIDEESPLFGCSLGSGGMVALTVTLTGHDGTYGQTTYSRHIYYAEDFKIGHRYADVISELPDGRLMIDLDRFHDTEPDPTAEAQA